MGWYKGWVPWRKGRPMTHIIDRILLYLLGMVLIKMNMCYLPDMVYILTGLILVGSTCYLGEVRESMAERVLYLILPLLTLCMPDFTPFVALTIYAGGYKYLQNRKYMVILILFSLAPTVYSGVFVPDASAWIWILMLFLAIYMAWKSHILLVCSEEIKHIRDDAAERNAILAEKNKYLANNQEKEIHIATLSERNRIAREIHDNVGHLLSRSILQLGAIMAIHKNEPVAEQLTPLKETLDNAMNNIRESVHDLHKESFDMKEAARRLLEELPSCETSLSCDMSMDADKEVKYAFLTILKEALTNVQKHSNATRVKVIVNELEEHYQLLIEDNGSVDVNVYHSRAGIGLQNMEERVRALGGIITFSGEKGFRIFISVPKKRSRGGIA